MDVARHYYVLVFDERPLAKGLTTKVMGMRIQDDCVSSKHARPR